MTGKLEASNARCHTLVRDLDLAHAARDSAVEDARSQLDQGLRLAKDAAEAQGRAVALERDLHAHRERLHSAETARADAAGGAVAAAREQGLLEGELAKRDTQIGELKAREAELVEQLNALSAELEAQRDVAGAEGQAAAELEQAREQVASLQGQILELQSQLEAAQRQAAELQDDNTAMLEARARLDEQLAELQAYDAVDATAAAAHDADARAHVEEASELRSECVRLRAELQDALFGAAERSGLQEKLAAAQAEMEELIAEANQVRIADVIWLPCERSGGMIRISGYCAYFIDICGVQARQVNAQMLTDMRTTREQAARVNGVRAEAAQCNEQLHSELEAAKQGLQEAEARAQLAEADDTAELGRLRQREQALQAALADAQQRAEGAVATGAYSLLDLHVDTHEHACDDSHSA